MLLNIGHCMCSAPWQIHHWGPRLLLYCNNWGAVDCWKKKKNKTCIHVWIFIWKVGIGIDELAWEKEQPIHLTLSYSLCFILYFHTSLSLAITISMPHFSFAFFNPLFPSWLPLFSLISPHLLLFPLSIPSVALMYEKREQKKGKSVWLMSLRKR